jgi:hypothetical protein
VAAPAATFIGVCGATGAHFGMKLIDYLDLDDVLDVFSLQVWWVGVRCDGFVQLRRVAGG